MLAQFTIKNYLSFGEKVTFSMVKSKSAKGLPSHVFPATESLSLLRGAAFYGANASGKSNFVKALEFVKQRVVQAQSTQSTSDVRPFKLDRVLRNAPSEFEFIVLLEGVFVTYGVVLDSQRVHREWCYRDASGQDSLVFERVTSEEGVTEIRFGEALSAEVQKRQEVAQATHENQLFLNAALTHSLPEFSALYTWFRDSLTIVTPNTPYEHKEVRPCQDADYTAPLSLFLAQMGLGIRDADSKRIPIEEVDFASQETLNQLLTSAPDTDGDYIALVNGSAVVVEVQQGRKEAYGLLLRVYHETFDGKPIAFHFEEVSEGTQRLIQLHPLVSLLHAPESCSVVVIDGLDSLLHPHLARHFVQIALGVSDTPPSTQLLFTAHETQLLATDTLRTDEIWFVEKDSVGASHLSSLVEFKYPTGLDRVKGYLAGRFGAIPLLTEAQTLQDNLLR